MSILHAIIYGIVQGITEFLPISSTAHLILLPRLMGWTDITANQSVIFDVALHLGTAVAVIGFFFKDWIRLIRAGLTKPKSQDGMLFWFIVVATIPGAIAGVALNKYMESFQATLFIAIMLIVMGIVLYVADKYSKSQTKLENVSLFQSVIIGISQVLAVIPGVSRSGITMSTGRFLGLDRASAAKFTFLMASPIILADGLYHAKDMAASDIKLLPFAIAVITAGIVGVFAIKFLLNYIKTKGFGIFAVYRVVLGLVLIGLVMAGYVSK
jgi:undecaprenyl-diphosphatase